MVLSPLARGEEVVLIFYEQCFVSSSCEKAELFESARGSDWWDLGWKEHEGDRG